MPQQRSRQPEIGIPEEVAAINKEIRVFMDTLDADGNKIGSTKYGVYAFFDYEEEPIYVGQTEESLRQRVGRHLTNQRTDAVAMSVLDPFEVAYIEVWPLPHLATHEKASINKALNSAEFSVFQKVLSASALGAVLNEKDITSTDLIVLPTSYRARIVPDGIFEARNHPDIRIARRAGTIARLAQVISERNVSLGLRRTLVTQAKRLERLASQRFVEFTKAGVQIDHESAGEETGETS